jgi:glycosyltransferase involved in cell wall biosynthesis
MLSLFDVCYIGLQKSELYKFGISPNKLYDYMYSGKPILQSIDIDNDIVKKANCGLCVEAENPESIADGILKLFTMNEYERKQLGYNGKKYVLDNFTYNKLADKLLYILNN